MSYDQLVCAADIVGNMQPSKRNKPEPISRIYRPAGASLKHRRCCCTSRAHSTCAKLRHAVTDGLQT